MTLVILVVLALSLFGLAFFTRRRYGVLGLALAGGLVLSQQVSKEFAAFLQTIDFPAEPLTFSSLATIVLILGPAIVLLFSGPKYSEHRLAIVGSVMFAIFGTLLLLAPLNASIPFRDPTVQPALSQIALNSPLIITAGVIVAVLDMMHAQAKLPLSKKSKH